LTDNCPYCPSSMVVYLPLGIGGSIEASTSGTELRKLRTTRAPCGGSLRW
jgi:hypothetical protein